MSSPNAFPPRQQPSAKTKSIKPFFSIITVVKNDAWGLYKTIRSVFEQDFEDFEYIIIDGGSTDGTLSLIHFWHHQGLVSLHLSAADDGVYHAMNRGIDRASGQYVCFMNAGDLFPSDATLTRVHDLLGEFNSDGLLGWGELYEQIWASWSVSAAYKMASLGFCHQALYVKRVWLQKCPFDQRAFKTDSDTLQLGRLLELETNIKICSEILAIRGSEPGISADVERTAISIRNTLAEEYPSLTENEAEQILSFRRRGENATEIRELLTTAADVVRFHLARVILDTLFQGASRKLNSEEVSALTNDSIEVLIEAGMTSEIDRLINAQHKREALVFEIQQKKAQVADKIAEFDAKERRRLSSLRIKKRQKEFIVSMTSFPKRISTTSYALQSLLEQSRPPKEIYLWLGRDEFPEKSCLPGQLLEMEKYGVKICFTKKSYHQYDKFIHIHQVNRELPLVIADDDVIYSIDSMEHLLEGHARYSKAVIGNRCHQMKVNKDSTFGPYNDWQLEVFTEKPSYSLFPTGAGAVLYPIGFFNNPETINLIDILRIAPYADDIWLKACALAQKIPTFATELSNQTSWYCYYTPTMREGTLTANNVHRGLNDVQIANMQQWLDQYSTDWRSLFTEDVGQL